jgi:hypothetical protein
MDLHTFAPVVEGLVGALGKGLVETAQAAPVVPDEAALDGLEGIGRDLQTAHLAQRAVELCGQVIDMRRRRSGDWSLRVLEGRIETLERA